jgi:hypothetical protein
MKPHRLVAAACLASATLLGTAIPATAATPPPEHLTFPVEYSFSFDDCGFVVDATGSATAAHVTLWRNEDGLVVRERDSGHLEETFTNTETGKTISVTDFSVHWFDYGSGAVLGSSVTITSTGMGGHVPGIGPEAGRNVATGTVVGFDPDGFPIVLPTDDEPLFVARRPAPDLCAALS